MLSLQLSHALCPFSHCLCSALPALLRTISSLKLTHMPSECSVLSYSLQQHFECFVAFLPTTFFLTGFKKVQVTHVPVELCVGGQCCERGPCGKGREEMACTSKKEPPKSVSKEKAFLCKRYGMLRHFCRYV